MAHPTAQPVDLQRINQFTEIVIRAGIVDPGDPRSVHHLMDRYEEDNRYNPVIYGLSTVFREGATVTELANAARFRNRSVSVSIINSLIRELNKIKHSLILYITPTNANPEHHTLAVAKGGVPQIHLEQPTAQALMKAFIVIDNPYQRP